MLLLCAGLLLLWSLARPHYNWDMLAYAAATERFQSADPNVWHQTAFDSARRLLPQAEFQRLTGTDPESFRSRVYADPQLFAAQLDFYTGRVAYIGATWLLREMGLNPLRAQHVVSGMAVALGLLCLALLLRPILPTVPLLLIPAAAALFGLLQIVRLGTPDAMMFAAVCAASLLLVRRDRAVLLLLPVLLCVRTDLILWTLPVYAYLLHSDQLRRSAVGASLLASVLVLFVLQQGHPGWSTLVHVTLIDPVVLDPAHPPPVGLADYVLLLKRGLLAMSADKAALLFLLLSVTAIAWAAARLRSGLNGQVFLLLILASLAYFVGHFLLFPVTWERFFVGPYCTAGVATMALVATNGSPTTLRP
jgi:hypothetical protein